MNPNINWNLTSDQHIRKETGLNSAVTTLLRARGTSEESGQLRSRIVPGRHGNDGVPVFGHAIS
jgi:hypothetical protein